MFILYYFIYITFKNLFILINLYIYVYIYTHHVCFIHSSVSGHLSCFHVLAIVNDDSVNTEMRISFQIMVFSGYMLRCEIAGSLVVLFLVF